MAVNRPETFDALMKLVIIGDTAVGKTCLILRYTHDTFRENFLSTIGVDFKTKKVIMNDKCYKLQVWDTAGQERYNTIRRNFYRGAKGIVIVYDLSNVDSFASITRWIDDVATNIGDDSQNRPAVLILANKSDMEEERQVERLAGEEAARTFGAKFAEVSARTGEGVEEAFSGLVKEMVDVIEFQLKSQKRSNDSLKLSNTITLRDDIDGGNSASCTC